MYLIFCGPTCNPPACPPSNSTHHLLDINREREPQLLPQIHVCQSQSSWHDSPSLPKNSTKQKIIGPARSGTTRVNPVHPPPHPRPTIDTDSTELDAVLLDQVTRGKPHTYTHQPQLLPVSPRILLLAVHTPQSIDESFQPVQT
ncbi:hypothetical protein AMECASPLE_011376 [Ameca splendens]|uniref:Uncharacterized protein n=1 Tax=Ameca splendens TaxID=208324 RepID=A0ABV0ZAV7_9TELE